MIALWGCLLFDAVVIWRWSRGQIRKRRYGACLRNIERLERELMPMLFAPDLDPDRPQVRSGDKIEWLEGESFGEIVARAAETFDMRPGAIWQVESADTVQLYSPGGINPLQQLQRAHAMAGTHSSARWARDIERLMFYPDAGEVPFEA